MFTTAVGQHSSPVIIREFTAAEGVNTDVVITLPATEGFRWVIHGIQWSYDSGSASGSITVLNGAVLIFQLDIRASDIRTLLATFSGNVGTEMILTLTGAAGSSGKLNCQARLYPT
jgi:hypothetical protein